MMRDIVFILVGVVIGAVLAPLTAQPPDHRPIGYIRCEGATLSIGHIDLTGLPPGLQLGWLFKENPCEPVVP